MTLLQVEQLSNGLGQGSCAAPAAVGKNPDLIGPQRRTRQNAPQRIRRQIKHACSRRMRAHIRIHGANGRPRPIHIPSRRQAGGR